MCLFESESVPTGEITPTYIWPPRPRSPDFKPHAGAAETTAGRALAAAWPVGRCNVVEMLAAKLRDPE
jgi:hypothetical protein